MSEHAFFVGVNLPWLQYGCDFGANRWQPNGGVGVPERRLRLRAAFSRLAERGFTTVRWFVLCDGRAGVRFDGGGTTLGLDHCFARDLTAGLEEAERAGICLVPVLFDFRWWRRARVVDGVRCGGHRRSISNPVERDAMLERVVLPVLRGCAGSPSVAAWDIVNEPEWVTRSFSRPLAPSSRDEMREFIRRAAAAVHAETSHPVTVGLASARGLGLVRHLDLDVYQVHWYDRRERQSPLSHNLAARLDRPVWLGEFPTAGSARGPEEILATASGAGYAAALAWSAEAVDRWSDLDRLRGAKPSRL